MAEIKISYSATPKGQVGPRPQRVKANEKCRFTCTDPGSLTMEFTNGSPMENGTKIGKDQDFVASKSGLFKFRCVLTPPGGRPIVLGDPNDPNSVSGGELLVGD
jgi:hypothetical protein